MKKKTLPVQALNQEEIDAMLMNEHDYPYQHEDSDFDDGSFDKLSEDELLFDDNLEGT